MHYPSLLSCTIMLLVFAYFSRHLSLSYCSPSSVSHFKKKRDSIIHLCCEVFLAVTFSFFLVILPYYQFTCNSCYIISGILAILENMVKTFTRWHNTNMSQTVFRAEITYIIFSERSLFVYWHISIKIYKSNISIQLAMIEYDHNMMNIHRDKKQIQAKKYSQELEHLPLLT